MANNKKQVNKNEKNKSTKVVVTRVKKNRKTYGNKIDVKNTKIHKLIIIALTISLICNIFGIIYFFNKNKPKEVKVIEKEEVVPENIVFLGDSITDYYDLKKYYQGYKVVNSGISGNISKDILDNMEERVYRYNPSKVFLLIGTNDIQRKVDDDEIIDNIKKIIENTQKNRPKAQIYVESIYPVNNTDNDKIDHVMVGDRNNKKIKELNKRLKDYCKENGIVYINLYETLADSEGNIKLEYTKEGLHLSDKGYEAVTKIIKSYLK